MSDVKLVDLIEIRSGLLHNKEQSHEVDENNKKLLKILKIKKMETKNIKKALRKLIKDTISLKISLYKDILIINIAIKMSRAIIKMEALSDKSRIERD